MTSIEQRMDYLKEKALEDAFTQPEKFDADWLAGYYATMIDQSKKSLKRLQDGMVHLVSMRDKYQYNLETAELIYNNIQLTQDCIKQESRNIQDFREEMKCQNSPK